MHNPTVPAEFLDRIEQLDIISSFIDTTIISPEVDAELLKLVREKLITAYEGDPFQFRKPGFPATQVKTNGHKGIELFDIGCLANVISYETCESLKLRYESDQNTLLSWLIRCVKK